jgi:radical SAM superfamily enzyme YgiQ (UPF0313 family)
MGGPGKVLLISANRCTIPDPVFPLGLSYLNAGLRAAGHPTAWLDLLSDNDGLDTLLGSYHPDFIGISLRNIDDVLIRKRESFVRDLAGLIDRIRRRTRSPVILGGSGFSIFPRKLIELSGADFGIRGPGEISFPALLAAVERGSDYQDVPGLVFRRDGKLVVNPNRGSPETSLSLEDWPMDVVERYLANAGMLNLQTQRGCPFPCCYCTYPLIEGARNKPRAEEIVVEEFLILQRLGAKYVFVADSVFNTSPEHVTRICEALVRRNVRLPWGCFLRPQGLTSDLLALMVRAGLAHAEFGSDSLSDTVLSAYHKNLTFEDILQSSELARRANLPCCHFLILGGPGETHDTLEEGFRNSALLSDAVILAVVGMRIYPGTQLFERSCREGLITPSTDLLPPTYYLAPGLNEESVFTRLRSFAQAAPGWLVGDTDPGYSTVVARLRHRGVLGPLWSYFALMRRLWPLGTSPRATLNLQ